MSFKSPYIFFVQDFSHYGKTHALLNDDIS